MTNSPSSALFLRFRVSQRAYAEAGDTAATDDKTAKPESDSSLGSPPADLIEDRSIVQEPSDEALMAMLGAGRQDAIACLFRRYARTIHAVGKRILHDTTEAEDLVQEVFLYVFRKRNLYDPSKGSARSWLVQIAYTQAFMRRRKLKTLGFYADRQGANPNWQPASIDGDHAAAMPLGRHWWNSILENLTSDQESVMRLHFFEGYTFAEIAEKLGQSYANVRNHHYRGLEKLRRHLAEGALNRR